MTLSADDCRVINKGYQRCGAGGGGGRAQSYEGD